MRKLAVILITLGAFALVACSDDTTQPPKQDKRVIKLDKGPSADGFVEEDQMVQEDSTVTTADQKVTQADMPTGPIAGFGAMCNATTPCQSNLECVSLPNQNGFCTKQCTNFNPIGECPGYHTGELSACNLPIQGGQYVCSFICQLKKQDGTLTTFNCPTGLECEPNDDPPGSGQRICMPAGTVYPEAGPAPADAGTQTE